MNDLEHRRALVAEAGLAGQHRDRPEIAARLGGGEAADAVRHHADLHAGAVESGQAAKDGRAVGDVGLRA